MEGGPVPEEPRLEYAVYCEKMGVSEHRPLKDRVGHPVVSPQRLYVTFWPPFLLHHLAVVDYGGEGEACLVEVHVHKL
jgi:hypothetical protein